MTDTHAAHGHDAHGHAAPKHPYHLVDPSPWPLVGAIAGGVMAVGGVVAATDRRYRVRASATSS